MEDRNNIYIWDREYGKWQKSTYVAFDEDKNKDLETTGLQAYQEFYKYCGKSAVETMKTVIKPVEPWESTEQMHYYNFEYVNEKIYKPIYEFDANSSFTYGVMQLPQEFKPLKDYMRMLYDRKRYAESKFIRNKYKNLQNYLIGYFARVKEFTGVRSEIIKQSNLNIKLKMSDIVSEGGTVYLSNTDSIVTDEIGAALMYKCLGDDVGQFKLKTVCDKLCYKSSNAYQLGDKLVYSGVKYFARKHTDLFNDISAEQSGSLIKGFDFILDGNIQETSRICRVKGDKIEVTVYNKLKEVIDFITYKLQIGV